MKLRSTLRNHMWSKIGDGKMTSAWYDKWSDVEPIRNFITPRMIQQAGLRIQSKIVDVVEDGQRLWPVVWMDIYPVLINRQPPNLNTNRLDTISWIDNEGKEVQYSSKAVWNTIHVRGPRVEWHNVVWFSQCVPRHAFLLWLVIGNKLKMQDKLKHWEVGGLINLRLMCYSLCQNGNDSHAHLFFECVFAAQIWSKVKAIGDMQHLTDNWENVLDHLVSKAKSKSAKTVIGRLLVAAIVYHIWQERNCRLFSDRKMARKKLQVILG
ncbi:uncharacterized protein LOC110884499 [Helianthus annuus]|uniref:uncharacterized protein LOC110884499 n=1 Tax=Helianthus annuus TaxID=4232 RepID=UPI000B901D2F|nr:uncharacterized protein LOC110884499 [Helianthus annuus]